MITNIKEIHNLGKYEEYKGNQTIGRNQIIFGFNGTGKSTLSDMFYSLAKKEAISLNRKTLDKSDGNKAGKIKIILNTENGEITYTEDEGWDCEANVYTFNEQYINDYVLVNREYNQDVALVAMGAEGVKLSKEKMEYIQKRDSNIAIINNFIVNNKEICSELGFGKTRIKTDSIKRLQTMSDIKLYTENMKNTVENELKKSVEFSKEAEFLKNCIEDIKKLKLRGLYASVSGLRKILETIPTVKNKEIMEHMKRCMKNDNIKWLISGFYNQANHEICPYCGQRIESIEAKIIINELQKFIDSRKQIKAQAIIEEGKKQIQLLDTETINNAILVYNKMLDNIQKSNLMLKSQLSKIALNFEWNTTSQQVLENILKKLWNKVENPYQIIKLEEEEIQCIYVINKTSKKISIMEKELDVTYSKLIEKLNNEKALKYKKALYQASFCGNREQYVEIKNAASKILQLNEKVVETTRKIDDAFDRVKLKKINELLKELNIKFTLNVERRQYYIKLKDYVPQKYEKNHSTICSEGEKRILAFAYFWSEIEEAEGEKIIVIDDPITSLDLSRKSVIAYKISELFDNQENQTIIMTHDIAFVEQIKEFTSNVSDGINMLELKNKQEIFYPLCIKDYLQTDEMVYKSFIENAVETDNQVDKIIGLMSLRPYTSLVNNSEYNRIEKESTYFAHTIYSFNVSRNIKYDINDYNTTGLRKYVNDVAEATKLSIASEQMIPEEYCFNGFDYDTIKQMYVSITLETVTDARKKAMLLRVFLEACLYQLTTKLKFNPERIGSEYKKVIRSCGGEKKKIAEKLKELYDFSKKYHHGVDEGSTLGLSWLNPDEMELFDKELKTIYEWIDSNCQIRRNVA